MPEVFDALRYPELAARPDPALRDAVQRGYSAGLARGRHRADAERREVLERVAARQADDEAEFRRRAEAALRGVETARAALEARTAPVLAEARRTLVDAALQLAEAVLGAPAGGRARAALDRVLAHPEAPVAIAVRLHPAAIAEIAAAGLECPVPLEPDASLAPGDAVAVLPDGLIDARIADALDRARRALEEDGA